MMDTRMNSSIFPESSFKSKFLGILGMSSNRVRKGCFKALKTDPDQTHDNDQVNDTQLKINLNDQSPLTPNDQSLAQEHLKASSSKNLL